MKNSGVIRKRIKRILLALLAFMVVMGPVTAWILPNIHNIITINDFDYTLDSGIVSLAPPGLVPQPPAILQATGPSDYVKTPHSLEGRVGFCFDCHSLSGKIPSPASHLGRPQDDCTVCHSPVWVIAETG
ncbi:MAG: hypothetical protein P3T54_09275 [Dehalogenimonas sp.]|jgi:hypothetical protein|uniref:Cytochrome c7-like domain-containing protein n=1 Tax=Candidatus Dehalogenimonas loeffleri TaxID=3127115 RepID=A0ABZ2J224_9CHLR|nr:hypothetical protein [Dehalogenimonas sp.]